MAPCGRARGAGSYLWPQALWREPGCGSRATSFPGLPPPWTSFLLSLVHPSGLEAAKWDLGPLDTQTEATPPKVPVVFKSTCDSSPH